MAVENRDVLSELMTYMDVLMSPEAGCRKRLGTYSRVPERLIQTLRRLEQCTDFLRRYLQYTSLLHCIEEDGMPTNRLSMRKIKAVLHLNGVVLIVASCILAVPRNRTFISFLELTGDQQALGSAQ